MSYHQLSFPIIETFSCFTASLSGLARHAQDLCSQGSEQGVIQLWACSVVSGWRNLNLRSNCFLEGHFHIGGQPNIPGHNHGFWPSCGARRSQDDNMSARQRKYHFLRALENMSRNVSWKSTKVKGKLGNWRGEKNLVLQLWLPVS